MLLMFEANKLVLEWMYKNGLKDLPPFEYGINLEILCRHRLRGKIRPIIPPWMKNSKKELYVSDCQMACDICKLACTRLLNIDIYAIAESFRDEITIEAALKKAPCGKKNIVII